MVIAIIVKVFLDNISVFAFFVSLNLYDTPVKKAELCPMVINFQEGKIQSQRAETAFSSSLHDSKYICCLLAMCLLPTFIDLYNQYIFDSFEL